MSEDSPERLLSGYLYWGIASICAFLVFVVLLLLAIALERADILLYLLLLLAGFLWIGVTSISRHLFVLLKKLIGKEISVFEFLSTQFIVLLFPFFYLKLRKEIRAYRDKTAASQNTRSL